MRESRDYDEHSEAQSSPGKNEEDSLDDGSEFEASDDGDEGVNDADYEYDKKHESRDEGDSVDSRKRRQPVGEDLFDDAGSRSMRDTLDRRLERAIASITAEMLEAVRLSSDRVVHILEHPRREQFLVGAYVRYPDLELIETGAASAYDRVPALPAQVNKVVELDDEEKFVMPDGSSVKLKHQLHVIQYTQRSDGSLKIRKAKLDLRLMLDTPFTTEELEKWQTLLKLFTGRSGAEKLQALPQILPVTAERLASFTFTAEDVDDILREKAAKQAQSGQHDKNAAVAFLNFSDLMLRRAELEYLVSDKQAALETATSKSARKSLEKELTEAQETLDLILDRLKTEKSENDQRQKPRSRPSSRGRGGEEQNMLVPQFLRGRTSVTRDTGPSRQQWKTLAQARVPVGIEKLGRIDRARLDRLYAPYLFDANHPVSYAQRRKVVAACMKDKGKTKYLWQLMRKESKLKLESVPSDSLLKLRSRPLMIPVATKSSTARLVHLEDLLVSGDNRDEEMETETDM